jgi:hypothetical protein
MKPALGTLTAGAAMVACMLAGTPTVAADRDPASGPAGVLLAQRPVLPHPVPTPPEGTGGPVQGKGELDCRGCHQNKHHGVMRMYLGTGGKGVPATPSHMFQVRVECIACHIAPKEGEATARFVGQTYEPNEQACVACHGEKYRGMLRRWADTLETMTRTVEPKTGAVRAALAAADPKHARLGRARELVQDADENVQFVKLGHGVHNVFYAGNLLRLSNAWVEEALRLLGKPSIKSDDALVRGGYCAVLCHDKAGVKIPAEATFQRQRFPHERHVTELGALCTDCHSAETHKGVSATPATCRGCHHGPANERCESCHRAQSAFYQGTAQTPLVTPEANVMVKTVTCTGCHEVSRKHSRQAVTDKCVGCHDASYAAFMTEWTSGLDKELAQGADAVKRAEAALVAARKAGRKTAEADALVKEARDGLALVKRARAVHNPGMASAVADAARKKAESALERLAVR